MWGLSDLSADTIGVSLGVFSAGIGALASGIGYVLKSRAEAKKNVNTVLFNLLEIYNSVRVFGVTPEVVAREYVAHFQEWAKNKHGRVVELTDFEPVAAGYFSDLMAPYSYTTIERLSARYQLCVERLSERSPVLAFQLAGRENIEHVLKAVDAYIERMKRAAEDVSPKEFPQAAASIREGVTTEVLSDLEKDVRAVAGRAGMVTLTATHYQLRRLRRRTKISLSKAEWEALFERIWCDLAKRTCASEVAPT